MFTRRRLLQFWHSYAAGEMYKVLLGYERLKKEPNKPADETNSQTEITSIRICHESPEILAATECGHSEKGPDETARSSLSTLAMTTFYLCSFTIRLSGPFDNFKHGYDQSLLLPLVAVFTFIVSLVSTFLMMFVGVRFSRMQKGVLLVSLFTLFMVPPHSIIILGFIYVATILFLWAGWFWSVKIKSSKCYPPICTDLVEAEFESRAKESTV